MSKRSSRARRCSWLVGLSLGGALSVGCTQLLGLDDGYEIARNEDGGPTNGESDATVRGAPDAGMMVQMDSGAPSVDAMTPIDGGKAVTLAAGWQVDPTFGDVGWVTYSTIQLSGASAAPTFGAGTETDGGAALYFAVVLADSTLGAFVEDPAAAGRSVRVTVGPTGATPAAIFGSGQMFSIVASIRRTSSIGIPTNDYALQLFSGSAGAPALDEQDLGHQLDVSVAAESAAGLITAVGDLGAGDAVPALDVFAFSADGGLTDASTTALPSGAPPAAYALAAAGDDFWVVGFAAFQRFSATADDVAHGVVASDAGAVVLSDIATLGGSTALAAGHDDTGFVVAKLDSTAADAGFVVSSASVPLDAGDASFVAEPDGFVRLALTRAGDGIVVGALDGESALTLATVASDGSFVPSAFDATNHRVPYPAGDAPDAGPAQLRVGGAIALPGPASDDYVYVAASVLVPGASTPVLALLRLVHHVP